MFFLHIFAVFTHQFDIMPSKIPEVYALVRFPLFENLTRKKEKRGPDFFTVRAPVCLHMGFESVVRFLKRKRRKRCWGKTVSEKEREHGGGYTDAQK